MAHARRRTSFLREPLLHFLLLGAGLFALHGWLNGTGALGTDRIVIDRGQVDHLAAGFARLHQRPPTHDELQGLIDEAIKEEVFYREALAQGLDRDDVIVRRRMMQKLEFTAEDIAPIPEPGDAQLQAWLTAHPADFALAPRYTFQQAYLDPQKHGARLEADAQALLATLRARGAQADAAAFGDPFLLDHRVDDAPADDLRGRFGARFVDALAALPAGTWQGPVASGFGLHLVFVERRDVERLPTLAEVRADVRREWLHAQRQARDARFYAGLRKRYDVRVEQPAPPSTGAGAQRVAELAQ
jgi:hypothetical protein